MTDTNINEKIKYAFDNSIRCHLKLKGNSWRNGYVTEIGSEFIIFDDKVNGKEPIFLIEIFDIEPYMEEGK